MCIIELNADSVSHSHFFFIDNYRNISIEFHQKLQKMMKSLQNMLALRFQYDRYLTLRILEEVSIFLEKIVE